jgi:glycosidase
MKMAAALNAFMSGSSFVYYGEELGMSGAGIDENKRAPMYWSDFGAMDGVCAGPAAMEEVKHRNGSLDTQKDDKFSIYWYYRNMFHIKNMYPEIARGTVAVMDQIEDGNVCAISKTYNGETIYILFNINKEATTVTVPKDTYNYEGLVAKLEVDENQVTMEGETVTLPAWGIAVIK